jgi:hypothetical protein
MASTIHAAIVDGAAHFVTDHAAFFSTASDGSAIVNLAGSLAGLTPADLEFRGIYALALPDAPEGEVEVTRSLTVEGGVPILSVTFGAPPASPVPTAVDMRQARLKLLDEPHGEGSRLDAVDAYVASQDQRAQIEWVHSKELRRDHPLVGIMGLFFEQTSADIDQWFREAAAIGPTLAI